MIRNALLALASLAILGTASLAAADNTVDDANNLLERSETQGGHARGQHVGKTGKQLRDRNIPTATTFQKKVDQNLAGRDMMNDTGAQQVRDEVKGKHNNFKKAVITSHTGRVRPIGKVVERRNGKVEEHNIKVEETTTVLKKGPGGVRVQTMYPSKYTKLEKPKSGPSLKPTTKHNVTDIATGKSGLRKVPAPKERGLDLGGQKKFGGVTKNVKKKAETETQTETTTETPKQTPKKTVKQGGGTKKTPPAKKGGGTRRKRRGGNKN